MKFLLVCVAVLGAVAMSKADTTALSFDAQIKTLADLFESLTNKVNQLSGMKAEFDKEKFISYCSKMSQEVIKFAEKVQKDSKVIPEEMKKKFDDVIKHVNDFLKGLSSPEVQAKATKLQETVNTSVKKVGESMNEVMKSFGLSMPPTIKSAGEEMFAEISKTMKVMQDKGQKMLEGIQEELKKKKAN